MYPNQIRNDANIERNVIDLQMINNFSDKNHITGETKEYLLLKLLESSKKNRIKSIAARFSVKLTDKNTKQQMIEAAVPAIEANFGVKLKQYSIDELKLAARCLTEREADPEFAQQIINSAPFCDGAVYLIAKKDKFFTAVPHELAGKLMMRFVTRTNWIVRPPLALPYTAVSAQGSLPMRQTTPILSDSLRNRRPNICNRQILLSFNTKKEQHMPFPTRK